MCTRFVESMEIRAVDCQRIPNASPTRKLVNANASVERNGGPRAAASDALQRLNVVSQSGSHIVRDRPRTKQALR
jgi:hypothetical protein